MKERKLRQHQTCSACHQPIGHTGLPLFTVAKVERHGIKMDAVKRQDGLAALLGGNAFLAGVMGPDEDMTQLLDSFTVTLCETCVVETPVCRLFGIGEEQQQKARRSAEVKP